MKKVIKHKVVGKLLVVSIDKKNFPLHGDAATKQAVRDEIEKYNKVNSESRLAKILKMLTPVTEAKKTGLMVQKKKIKHEQKELKGEISKTKQDDKALNDALDQVKLLSETNMKNEQRIKELEESLKKVSAVPEKKATEGVRRRGEY